MTTTVSLWHRSIRPALARVALATPVTQLCTRALMRTTCRTHGVRVASRRNVIDLIKDERVLRLNPRHWIYMLTLARQFDQYFDCVVPFVEEGRRVVDYSQPRLQKFTMSGLDFEVASFPEEERAILDYFRWYRPRDGETVFDLGANCGLSTYYLSKAVGDHGTVVAFEPDPVNHEVLLRNIARHGLTNVVTLRKAIAARTATLAFYCEGTIGSTLAHQASRTTTGKTIHVEALTLADACQAYGLPTFIKMDIEGAEVEVCEGSRDFLEEHAVNLAIDTNHYQHGTLTCARVETALRKCGYQVLTSDESGFATTWARKNGTEVVET